MSRVTSSAEWPLHHISVLIADGQLPAHIGPWKHLCQRTVTACRVENLEGVVCPFNGEVVDSDSYSTTEL